MGSRAVDRVRNCATSYTSFILPPAQAQIQHQQAQFGFTVQAKLQQDVAHVGLDRLGRDHQCGGDLAVGVAACRPPQDLSLARGSANSALFLYEL